LALLSLRAAGDMAALAPSDVTPQKGRARLASEATTPGTSAGALTRSLGEESSSSSPQRSQGSWASELGSGSVRRVLDFDGARLEEGGASAAPEAGGGAAGPLAGNMAEVLLDARDVAPCPAPGGAGRAYWEAFFVVAPLFCGYAALFGLQHNVKAAFKIKDDSSSLSHDFGVAVSALYISNLIFRFAHNIFFGCVTPRKRVYLSMTAMMLSMLVIAVVIMILESHRLCWVVLAYSLGGVGVGSFESNLLACLTPFGHRTKHIAILGIPVGITLVLVGGFFLMGPPFELPVTTIYLGVAVGLFLGMLVLALRIPVVANDPSTPTKGQIGLRKFVDDVRQFRRWLPQLWHYPVATMVDMFTLSCFSPGVALYLYNQKTVAVGLGVVMHTDSFFAAYNTTNMLGGLLGRWMSYKLSPRHPLVYSVFNLIGVALLLTRVPSLAPLSTFLVMLGDGLIYGTVSRHIDTHVPKEFNLTALSYWLFIGDFGSIFGSNMISYIRDWVVGS